VDHLHRAGHEVIPTSLEVPADASWEPLDLTDGPSVRRCLATFEPGGIVHCAARASVGASWDDPAATYRTNIEGTANLLEAVKDLKPRVLLVGSAQQYAPPSGGRPLAESDDQLATSPYSLTKIAQEHMGLMYYRQYGVPVVFSRSFNHTGPGQAPEYAVGSFASQVARLELEGGGEMHVGNLDARRDFLDVRDVVRAYTLLLESGEPGEAYNVCSGHSVRMGEVLDKLLGISGLTQKVRVHPQARHVSDEADLLVGDPKKISKATGWAPQLSLDRSLQDALDWYRSALEDRQ
jgi:GDP-4-dehydro-6-deoxy-D-mannose reductase